MTLNTSPQVDDTPMHSVANKFRCMTRSSIEIQSQPDQNAPRHILSEEILSRAADDQHRFFILILFHVDARPVAHVVPDKNFASPD